MTTRFSTHKRALIVIAVIVILCAVAAPFTHVRGWRDVAVGTNSVYVGLHIQDHSISLMWQAGH